IKIFPISMIMNGKGQYNLIAQHRLNVLEDGISDEPSKIFDYNVGNIILNNNLLNVLIIDSFLVNEFMLNGDNDYGTGYTAPSAGIYGSIGPGIYKVVFNNTDSIIVEYDGAHMDDFGIYYRNGEIFFFIHDLDMNEK
ncbi:MAG TPA: hypothetical protein VN514_09830, partial [Ignavibacteria bacterium]|nr:hypothetical protein [Ignavibacteria bacterium]